MVRSLVGGWSKSNHSDFSDRYADNWRSTTAKAHVSTAGVCCYCCRKPSQEVHHGHYRRLPTAVLLSSLLWFCWFPAVLLLQLPWLLLPWLAIAPIVLLFPQLKIKGKEVIGWDVFPVCGSTNERGSCHHRLHNRGNWIIDKRNPKWGNHNKFSTICRLRLGWLILKLKASRR